MSNIYLKDFIRVIDTHEVVKIYKECKHKSEGYKHIITCDPIDILVECEGLYVLNNNLIVVNVSTKEDPDFGEVISIVVKEIGNESK